MIASTTAVKAPVIDWSAISPIVALTGGACLVLMVGLLRSRFARSQVTPFLTLVTLGVTAGLSIWQWGENVQIVERALAIDDLTLSLTMLFVAAGVGTVLMSWRSTAVV